MAKVLWYSIEFVSIVFKILEGKLLCLHLPWHFYCKLNRNYKTNLFLFNQVIWFWPCVLWGCSWPKSDPWPTLMKIFVKWSPVGPHSHHLFFLNLIPWVVLSVKCPNKGPKWGGGGNPGWDPQTRHNNFLFGSITDCSPISYAMAAMG
jgi:hypothetical protein